MLHPLKKSFRLIDSGPITKKLDCICIEVMLKFDLPHSSSFKLLTFVFGWLVFCIIYLCFEVNHMKAGISLKTLFVDS